MSKPIVHYTPSQYNYIKVGHSAIVCPIDHPSESVSNTTMVKTSTVVSITADGFETRNTIYKEQQHAV